jgi:transposase-like protein
MHPGAPAEPVLAAWGIDTDGKPVFVGLAPAASESTDAWDDFPTDQAAFKVLYLVSTERLRNRSNPTGRINGWKHILNTLTIHYNDRITAVTN